MNAFVGRMLTRIKATSRRQRLCYSLAVLMALLLIVYLAIARPWLMLTMGTVWVELAIVGLMIIGLALAVLVVLGIVVVTLVISVWTRKRERATPWLRRLRRAAVVMLVLILALGVVVLGTQWLAYTPPILGPDGKPLPGSIATLEKVELGGSEQWISVRGKDVDNPVLLFLAGGPGGSQLAPVRTYLDGLEDHFVVVNWDQPGSAKSYDAVALTSLTPERYVSDAHELAQYLRQRFGEEKIYVVGESWGSAVYIGQWRKEAATFLEANEKQLAERPVWLFSSGPTGEGDPVQLMKGWCFPEAQQPIADRIQPRDIAFFHGVLDKKKLNLAEKLVVKGIKAPVGDFRDWDAITAWAADIAGALNEGV